MLNKLYFELVPQKEGKEIWGMEWIKLDCAVQHCLAVFTSQPASVRRRVVQDQKLRPGSMGCAIGHNVLVHHLDPLLSVELQARLHEVQRGRTVASTHDAKDHQPSRGVRLRRRQSQRCLVIVKRIHLSEVQRDSQIGSDTLKLSGTREKMTMFPQAEERLKKRAENRTRRSIEGLGGSAVHAPKIARARHVPRQLRDMADPNRSSCSDGWVARAAGKRTRQTRRRRGAAILEQLASACQPIVSMGEET